MIHDQYQIETDETSPPQDLRERRGREQGAARGPRWKDPEPEQSCVLRFRCPACRNVGVCSGEPVQARARQPEPPRIATEASNTTKDSRLTCWTRSFKDETGAEQQTNDTDFPSSSRFRGPRARCARQECLFRHLCLHRYRPVVFLRVTVGAVSLISPELMGAVWEFF